MTPYWFMFLMPFIAVFSPVRASKDLQLFAWLSFGVLAVFFIGTRHEVGGDWDNYLKMYYLVTDGFIVDDLRMSDIGYAFLNWLMAQLNFGIYGVNLVCALIFVGGLIKFSRTLPLPWLAVLVAIPYLFVVVGNGYARQAVALGFELFALCALARLATVKFFLFVILAALFHKSAVVLALFGIFSGPNKFAPLRILLGGLVAIVTIGVFLQASYEDLILHYVEQKMESAGGLIRVLMNVVPAIVMLLIYKQWVSRFGKQEPWLIFALLSLICVPLVLLASTAVDRMALYLLPLQLYVWSHFPLLFKNPMFRYAALLGVIGYYIAVMWVWLNLGHHAKYWLPYQSVLFL